MLSKRFQELWVDQLSEKLADDIWKIVNTWQPLAQNTVGKQIICSADNIGANIAEGVEKGSSQENRRFVKIARGSLYETQHWLRRAYNHELAPQLNAYLNSIGNIPDKNNQ